MGRKSKRKKHREAIIEKATPVSHDSGLALFLKRVVEWGVYASLFTPLVVSAEFFFPFVVPKTVFFWVAAEIIFAAWVVLAVSNKQFRPRWDFINISVLLFLAVAIFTSFTGVNIERSFWSTFERMSGIVNWLHLGIYFIAVSSTFRTEREWKRIVGAALFAATAVSLAFLLPKINEGLSIVQFDTRGGSTIGNSSFMAAYLLFGVFLGLWLTFTEKTQWLKSFYAVCLSLIIFTVFISTAYGALVSMLGGFFLILVAWLFFSGRLSMKRAMGGVGVGEAGAEIRIPFAKTLAVFLVTAGIFISGVIGWGTFAQNEAILSKLPYFFSREGAIGARLVVWDIAWQGVKEKSILGWGPENFNVVFTKHFNPCLPLSTCGAEVWYDRTHNIVLDHFINSGIVGLLSYLLIYAATIYTLFKFWLFKKIDSGGAGYADWLFPSVIIAALGTYFVQNFLVFDMINTYLMFALVLAFVAGMKSGKLSLGEDEKRHGPLVVHPLTLTLAGIFLVYSVFSFGVQSLEAAHWGLVANASSMPLEERLELYKKSLSLTSLGNRQIPEFFTNNVIKSLGAEQNPTPEFVFELVRIMEKTSNENPLDYRQKMILGTLYFHANRYDPSYISKAEETMKEAMEMSPKNQQTYTSLAQVYFSTGRYDEAAELLEKAALLEPSYRTPYLHLIDVYAKSGKYEDARIAFEKALSLGFTPRTVNELEGISQVFENLGEYERAIFWYGKIVEKNLEEPKYFMKLASLYRKNGDEDKARTLDDIARQLSQETTKQ